MREEELEHVVAAVRDICARYSAQASACNVPLPKPQRKTLEVNVKEV
jgi:hypothetical protein